eukprot:UN04490
MALHVSVFFFISCAALWLLDLSNFVLIEAYARHLGEASIPRNTSMLVHNPPEGFSMKLLIQEPLFVEGLLKQQERMLPDYIRQLSSQKHKQKRQHTTQNMPHDVVLNIFSTNSDLNNALDKLTNDDNQEVDTTSTSYMDSDAASTDDITSRLTQGPIPIIIQSCNDENNNNHNNNEILTIQQQQEQLTASYYSHQTMQLKQHLKRIEKRRRTKSHKNQMIDEQNENDDNIQDINEKPQHTVQTQQHRGGSSSSNLYRPPTPIISIRMPLKPILRRDAAVWNNNAAGLYSQL